MKVQDLIKILKKADPKAEIILSSDPEGNSFHKLYQVETDNVGYDDEYGEIGIGFIKFTEELEEKGYTKEDCGEENKKCIVLWPG